MSKVPQAADRCSSGRTDRGAVGTRQLVAAVVDAVAVVVHGVHPVQGVRVLVGFGVVDQRRLVLPLEVLGRLVVEPGHTVGGLGVGGHGGLEVGLPRLERDGLLRISGGIHHQLHLGEAVGAVEDVAGGVRLRAVHFVVAGERDGLVGGEGVGPAAGLGQPRHVAVLHGEVGRGGLRGPGADELHLLLEREQVAVLVGEVGQGRFLVAHVVQARAHLQRDGVAGAQVAVGPDVVPEGGQQALVLQELGVGGVVGGRQLYDHGLPRPRPRLHVGGIGRIGQVVHVGLAVLGMPVGLVADGRVGVGVVVGLHPHGHGPALLHQLLGGQPQVLLLLVLALGELRLARDLVLHRAGVGVAVLVGVLHVEGVVVARIVAEQPLEVGRRDHVAQVHELVAVVEGHLLGQVQREHQLGVLQRALLALLGRLALVGDDRVAQRGGEPQLVVVLEGSLGRIGVVVGQRGARGGSLQGQRRVRPQVARTVRAGGGDGGLRIGDLAVQDGQPGHRPVVGAARQGRGLVLQLRQVGLKGRHRLLVQRAGGGLVLHQVVRAQGGGLQPQLHGSEHAAVHVHRLVAVDTGGEGLGLGGPRVGGVGGGRPRGVLEVVVQVRRGGRGQPVLGAEVVLGDVQPLVARRAGQPHGAAAGIVGGGGAHMAALFRIGAEVAGQVVVLHAVVGLGARVVEVVGQAVHALEAVAVVVVVSAVVAAAVPGGIEVVVLPLVAVDHRAVGVGGDAGAQVGARVGRAVVSIAVMAPNGHVGGAQGVQPGVGLAVAPGRTAVARAAVTGRGAHGERVGPHAGMRDGVVGELLVAGHGAGHVGAHRFGGTRGLLVQGQLVPLRLLGHGDGELEGVHLVRGDALLGFRVAAQVVALGQEAHHEAVAVRVYLAGRVQRGVGLHLLVGDRGGEVLAQPCQALVLVHLGLVVPVGVRGLGDVPILVHELLGNAGPLAVRACAVSAVHLRDMPWGSTTVTTGSTMSPIWPPIQRVGGPAGLVVHEAVAVHVPVEVAVAGGEVARQGIPPEAVLHMHVDLARVGLGLQVVVGGGGAHAVSDGAVLDVAAQHVGQAHGVPGAHHRLAHDGARAGLGVEHGARSPLLLVGLAPERAVGGSLPHGVGHRGGVGYGGGAHGVVLHGPAVHRGHVGAAGQLGLAGAGAVVALQGVLVVHAEGLHVVVALLGQPLEVVDVEDLVVGRRAAGLLACRLVLTCGATLGGGTVPRADEHAVVPALGLVVAEHVGVDVHLDLIAAVARKRVGDGVGIGGVGALRAHDVGVGAVPGAVVDGAAEPFRQVLLDGDLQHPGLRAVAIGHASVRAARGRHGGVGALRGIGGHRHRRAAGSGRRWGRSSRPARWRATAPPPRP